MGLSLILIMISGFAAAEQRPNVLLIVADDMGWNDLSITGNPTISTPNLERLAERGSLFTQFSVAAPICTPSRAAMLTGRLPIRTGVYADEPFPIDNLFRVFYPSSVNCLPEEEVTIGDALKAGANYSTAMIGKWHLGHNPEKNCLPGNGKQGFDFFYGLPYSHEEGYPGPFPEGFVFPPVPLLCDDKYVEQPYNGSDLTSRYTSLAIDMLDRFAAGSGSEAGGAGLRGRGRGERAGPKLHDNEHVRSRLDGKTRRLDYSKPFFLHVAYENPHVPLFVSDKYAAEHEPSRRGLYGDAVQEMDASIGEILDALDETGLADNTIIMFMSDNGAWVDPSNGLSDRPVQGMSSFDGGSNAPFYEGKGSTWEGGFRVPLIVAMPPSQPKQPRFIRAPTMGIDLFPTILDYAGVPTPEGVAIDGVSLRSILQSASAEDPHDCLYYWRENELYAIRCGSYKAHFKTRSGFNTSDPGTEHHPPLLFQLEWDPAERLPLPAADYASVLAGLTAAADAHVAEIERVRPPSLYLAQNLTLMPCCPRGSNQGIVVGDVPDHWSDCVCTRLIEV